MKFNKIWGKTEQVMDHHLFEVHRIHITKGGYCSKHLHNYKYNLFYIESGELEVRVFKADSGLTDRTILREGQRTVVKPRENHQFMALEDTVAYEIYWPEFLKEDIVRKSVGGLDHTQ